MDGCEWGVFPAFGAEGGGGAEVVAAEGAEGGGESRFSAVKVQEQVR